MVPLANGNCAASSYIGTKLKVSGSETSQQEPFQMMSLSRAAHSRALAGRSHIPWSQVTIYWPAPQSKGWRKDEGSGGEEAPHDQVMFTFLLDAATRKSRVAG
jgi:hypothetical protein